MALFGGEELSIQFLVSPLVYDLFSGKSLETSGRKDPSTKGRKATKVSNYVASLPSIDGDLEMDLNMFIIPVAEDAAIIEHEMKPATDQ